HPHPRRHQGSGNDVGARSQYLQAARSQFRLRLHVRRPFRRPRVRRSRPHSADGRQPYHAEFRRHHRRRCRQPVRRGARRPHHRSRGGHHHDLLPRGQRGDHLSDHADRPGGAAARFVWRGRAVRMKRPVAIAAMWLALIALPWWLPQIGGYTALGSKVLIYAIATMGLNILLGFTGGLSFGQAAYFGLGAYGAGMTLKYLAPSTPLAILIGTLAGGLAATILGPLVMRRRGIYFAMITIAIGQLFYFIMVRWNNVTGGEDGLAGFSRQDIHLGGAVVRLTEVNFYYLVLICFSVAVAAMWVLLQSPLGHTWVAIRENRRRMEFLGVRVERYVWAAFAVAGFITALAGTLNALLFNFTSPQDLHWILSGDFVIMIVLGGMRSFWGPLLGVIIFVVAQDYLSSLTDNWMSLIGLMFVLIVLLFPRGLLGALPRGGKLA